MTRMPLTLTLLVACGDNVIEVEQPPIVDEPLGRTITGSHVVYYKDVAHALTDEFVLSRAHTGNVDGDGITAGAV